MFILETSFEERKQIVYWIKQKPTVYDKGFNQYVTRINCFFHRMAKDNIRYNVTRFRQFTRHDDFEVKSYRPTVTEEMTLETLNDFFEKVGFNYKTKTWKRVGETCRKWNNETGKFEI